MSLDRSLGVFVSLLGSGLSRLVVRRGGGFAIVGHGRRTEKFKNSQSAKQKNDAQQYECGRLIQQVHLVLKDWSNKVLVFEVDVGSVD